MSLRWETEEQRLELVQICRRWTRRASLLVALAFVLALVWVWTGDWRWLATGALTFGVWVAVGLGLKRIADELEDRAPS